MRGGASVDSTLDFCTVVFPIVCAGWTCPRCTRCDAGRGSSTSSSTSTSRRALQTIIYQIGKEENKIIKPWSRQCLCRKHSWSQFNCINLNFWTAKVSPTQHALFLLAAQKGPREGASGITQDCDCPKNWKPSILQGKVLHFVTYLILAVRWHCARMHFLEMNVDPIAQESQPGWRWCR